LVYILRVDPTHQFAELAAEDFDAAALVAIVEGDRPLCMTIRFASPRGSSRFEQLLNALCERRQMLDHDLPDRFQLDAEIVVDQHGA
jgi:hypothetical protein